MLLSHLCFRTYVDEYIQFFYFHIAQFAYYCSLDEDTSVFLWIFLLHFSCSLNSLIEICKCRIASSIFENLTYEIFIFFELNSFSNCDPDSIYSFLIFVHENYVQIVVKNLHSTTSLIRELEFFLTMVNREMEKNRIRRRIFKHCENNVETVKAYVFRSPPSPFRPSFKPKIIQLVSFKLLWKIWVRSKLKKTSEFFK